MEVYAAVTTHTPDGMFTLLLDAQQRVCVAGFGAAGVLVERFGVTYRGGDAQPRHPYSQAVERYFKGDSAALAVLPYVQEGRPLQQAVWRVMREIPHGQTKTYADVARQAGYPAAVRAVATACGQNRLALLTPCHRVVRSDGSYGMYLYGAEVKRSLLERERQSA